MKRLLYTIFILIVAQTAFAQENNTMYFMKSLPQTKWLNPAKQSEYRQTLGGALIPITGQLFLPLHVNYSSNTLALENVFQYNSKMDVLALPGFKGFNKKLFYDELKDINFINLQTGINLLSIGYKAGTWEFGLNIHQKTEGRIFFSKDFIKFALEGNGSDDFLGKTISLGNLGMDFNSYVEYALSFSKQFGDKLSVGLSAKMLSGQANIWTERSTLDLSSNHQDNYPTTLQADVLIHTSQPTVEVTEAYYDYEGDSVVFETVEKELTVQKAIFNTQNLGFGVDAGFIYTISDRIELQASVLDLGYINWTDNSKTLSVKGEYNWEGYDFQPKLTENQDIIEAHNDSLRDDLIRTFNPRFKNGSYTTYLKPKVYLGGTFALSEGVRAGLLFRGIFYQNQFHPSAIFSGNFKLSSWFEAVASYSIINNTYNNAGLGFVMRGSIFQLFMVTDNLVGIILPQSTQNVTFRMGLNIVLGREDKKKPLEESQTGE